MQENRTPFEVVTRYPVGDLTKLLASLTACSDITRSLIPPPNQPVEVITGLDGFTNVPGERNVKLTKTIDGRTWQYFNTDLLCYTTFAERKGRLLIGYDPLLNIVHLGFSRHGTHGFTTGTAAVGIRLITYSGLGQSEVDDEGTTKALTFTNRAGDNVFNIILSGTEWLRLFERSVRIIFTDGAGSALQEFSLAEAEGAVTPLADCIPG